MMLEILLIDLLDLSVRPYNLLKRNNINTVEQLLELRQSDLFRIRNFTPQSYEEIRRQLIVHGFMKPTQPIGPFLYESDTLLQIPWQQVHIFCASEKILALVNAFKSSLKVSKIE